MPKKTKPRRTKKPARKKVKRRSCTPTPEPRALIPSQTSLARELKISQPAVSKMLRHADWPFGSGPWNRPDLPAIRAWRAEHLRPDPATAEGRRQINELAKSIERLPPKARQEVLKLQLQVRALERDEQVANNQLHDVAACTRRHRGFYEAAKGRLLEMISSVPGRLEGLSGRERDRLRELLMSEVDAVLALFAEDPPGPFPDT